jgi:hypothetical protein
VLVGLVAGTLDVAIDEVHGDLVVHLRKKLRRAGEKNVNEM